MKNLIISIAIILLFISCKAEPEQSQNRSQAPPIVEDDPEAPPPVVIIIEPTSDTPGKIVPVQPVQPVAIIPPPQQDPTTDTPQPAIIGPIRLAMITETGSLYFYDGTTFKDQSADSPKNCGHRCFTNGTVLNYYDGSGDVYASYDLPVIPTFITRDATTGTTVIVENIDPATAYSLGARYTNYAKIRIDGIEKQWWFSNPYTVKEMFQIGTDVFTKDSFRKIRDVNEALVNINAASGLIVHNFNFQTKMAEIRTDVDRWVIWGLNNFNNAKEWQLEDGIWYSQNGYEFDGFVLTENANPLWNWNASVIIGAGTRPGVTYWIDASSGWLWLYTKATDTLGQMWRLYQGDGIKGTGLAKRDILKPVLIGSELYFNDGGAVWVVDIDTGLSGLFFAGSAEVVSYE